MRAGEPIRPVELNSHTFTLLIYHCRYALQKQPGDPLPLRRRRRVRLPHGRQVTGQHPDGRLVGGRQSRDGRLLPTSVLLLQVPLLFERLLPATFQFAAHQPVLRLTGPVLAGGPFGLVTGTLQTQLPVLDQRGAFALHLRHGGQAGLQRRWLDGRQDLAGHQVIQYPTRQALTQGLGVVGRASAAAVPEGGLPASIVSCHPPATPRTAQQSTQKGRSLTRGAQRLVTCPVVRQALLVGLEALPAAVGRQLVADQHQAVLGTADASACTGAPRLLTTGVRGPIAVAVGPRVDRVVQQVLQGPARGAAPL